MSGNVCLSHISGSFFLHQLEKPIFISCREFVSSVIYVCEEMLPI